MNLLKAFKGKAFVVPLAILAALVMLAVNEAAYWQSKRSMDILVSMGASRATILDLTENLVNVESSQRGFVIAGNEDLLKLLDGQTSEIEEGFQLLAREHAHILKFMAALDRFRTKVNLRLSLLKQAAQLRREGRLDEAIRVALQTEGTIEVVHALDDELLAIETAGRDERRVSVYQALMVARIGVAVFTALGLLALLLYLRQAKQLGRHQQDLKVIERTLRDKLETEVAERTAELTDLTRYLLTAREDERARLARNLHDDLGALLTSAKLDAARIKPRIANSAPEALELLVHLVTSLNACVALGRDIIENLRPSALGNLGLAAALEILAGESAQTSAIQILCELEPVKLSEDSELTVYRLVQEALTNAAKYAKASLIQIKLVAIANQARITVIDNGVGFQTRAKPSAAYGLLGMRLRVEASGGTLSVTSAPNRGTEIQATLPLAVDDAPCQPNPTQPAPFG